MKVLLLNPPAIELVLRDYCCSETSKANYYWPPIDLLVLSGILNEKHEVKVFDANINRSSPEEAKKEIIEMKPDIIISLTGAVSICNDMKFLKGIKSEIGCKLLVIGDIAYFEPEMTLKMFTEIDGILFEFTSNEILKYLKGQRKSLKDIALREGGKIIIGEKGESKEITYPIPRHEMFPIKKYSMPFAKYKGLTTILVSSYGCPFNCTYCPSGRLKFKKRNIDEFIDELKYVRSLGIREAFFRDFTFNASKEKVKEICIKIMENGIDFSWICEARVDCIDEEMLNLMKKAGCNTIMFGVETYDDEKQKDTKKFINARKIEEAFRICKKLGITTLGHFIIGLPGEDEKSILKTIEFSKRIGCDYAAFNLYVPRMGTVMRKHFIENKKIEETN